jgi:Fic family protein
MDGGDCTYIWQCDAWPRWRYALDQLVTPIAEVSYAQGLLLGRLLDVGVRLREETNLAVLSDEVVKSSAIEGEELNRESVRSSIAHRLGIEIAATASFDRRVDGVVKMLLDATACCDAPLTSERLFGWHTSLFPAGHSDLTSFRVGAWRDDANGAMQVISGPIGRRRVHYEAPPAASLDAQMQQFMAWANQKPSEPGVLKAGLAHLWFVTLHPFEDGNGRIARAIGELMLARAERSPQRFYSLSAQLQRDRKQYYEILERTQKGTLDTTEWLMWFLTAIARAIHQAQRELDAVLLKTRFWQRWAGAVLNARQVKLLNKLLDGFEGKLTTTKWAKIAKCSADTALRDINALVKYGIIIKATGGGRNTAYELVYPAEP